MSQYQVACTDKFSSKLSSAERASQLLSEVLISVGYAPSEVITQALTFEEISLKVGKNIFSAADDYDAIGADQDLASDLYFIGQGKVRLLTFDPIKQRSITSAVLEAGNWFGADDILFPGGAIQYESVGAAEGVAYRLRVESLKELLKCYPKSEPYLSAAIHNYQRVAFLRTQPKLQYLSGKQIRDLATQAKDIRIASGSIVNHLLCESTGFYILRSGNVQDKTGRAIAKGEIWQGQSPFSKQSQASTNLLVHYLPADVSEKVAMRQTINCEQEFRLASMDVMLRNNSSASIKAEKFTKNHNNDTSNSLVSTSQNQVGTSPKVVFPKPLRRKLLDQFQQYPWIEQQSSSDCGAACLAMISCYWGKRLPIHVLREKSNVGRSGASLKSLAKGAESIGFNARPVRASFNRMAEQTNPWIAHWQGNHYIVVYQVEAHRVIVADPALGKKYVSKDEFKKHWTGYALLLEPTEQLRDTEFRKASLGRYIKLLVPYRALIFQIILVSLLIQLFSLVTPLFTQLILDKIVVRKSMSTLNIFAIGLVIFSAWSIVMSTVRSYLLAYFSMRLDLTMISGFIKHAISLPLKFYETRRVGDIITRVQENQKIQRFLIGQVMLAWLGFLTGFVYLGLMLYYNFKLTLMVLSLIPPIIIVTLISTPFLRRISREVFKEAANQNSNLVEMMNGIAAIKSAGVEQEVRWRWEDSLIQLKNVSFKGQQFGIGLGAVNGAINTLGGTALLWLGAAMVIHEQLTIGQFVAFNMMIGQVLNPVVSLANLWDELQEIFISVERLNDVFETQPEESADRPFFILPEIKGAVAFEKVTFRYSEDAENNTLENIIFEVLPGQTIAVVGRSGSGKTTLVKLLEGLYHPSQGRIFVDGHDIRHVSPNSLRTQLGVVPQECFLFSGTILENITLYRHDYSLEKAVEAAKLAEAHAFIQELPLGYNTQVGERGTTLSGGQRQRIAIARALLGNPRILILDEATSSLDTESERRFQRNLNQISRDRTTFIIAHRLSTVRNADQILVLDRGLLVEQGNHEQLFKQEGLYWSLAQQQLDI